MKQFFNSCRKHRQDICLLASGVLPKPEREQLKLHLAVCVDCRTYFEEIEYLTAPLANWENDFAHLQPGQAVQTHWAMAVQAAGRMEPVAMNPKSEISMSKARPHPDPLPRGEGETVSASSQNPPFPMRGCNARMFRGNLTPATAIREWWLDVIWPYRRVWAGLAVVWVLIFIGNLSLHDHPQALARKASPPTQEMIMAFKDQQTVLAELLEDHSVPRAAEPPKIFSPRPRTARGMLLSA